jgi:Holliday junction resolvasome RuvABC DNA-binding subunit
MKKELRDWIKQNPEKGSKRGKASAYEAYKTELLALLEAGYSTQKIAQYLEEVEGVAFKQKDGKRVITSLGNYLRDLAKEHNIKRAGRSAK